EFSASVDSSSAHRCMRTKREHRVNGRLAWGVELTAAAIVRGWPHQVALPGDAEVFPKFRVGRDGLRKLRQDQASDAGAAGRAPKKSAPPKWGNKSALHPSGQRTDHQ